MKGTIRARRNKDGSTSYLCQVYVGRDPKTGRRRYRTAVATSQRQAHRLVHELLAEVDGQAGTAAAGTSCNLAELIEAWLATGGPASESTRLVYAGYIKRHIVPHLGHIALNKLRAEDLDRWYVTLRESGLAPPSIRKAHNIVRAALAQAVRWTWVPVNVAVHASPPRVPKPVIATPKPASVRTMVQRSTGIDPRFGAYLRLSAVTGARPGEVCGLRLSDIDWAQAELHIRRRLVRSSPQPKVEDLTKTGKTRCIPLDARTLQLLQGHVEQLEDVARECGGSLGPQAYLFSDDPACRVPWRPDSTSRRFRQLRQANGWEDVPLYGLRHQAATAMIDNGVDARTVSERLGNSVTTVLGTYTRARSAADRSAADLMGNLLD